METIYSFVKKEEIGYTKPVTLEDGWDWSMKNHLRRSFLYKNSQFEEKNEDRDLRPNKNIILAIMNVQYRTEGFDVKDIDLYADDPDDYYKSFVIKKFHNKWALENSIDTFIDDMIVSYGDYGGVLVRDTSKNRPEVVDLRSLAFCNQTNILDYPFCIKHKFSPSQLREMDKWGLDENGANTSIEALITLCKDDKDIEVYELHGSLPKEWLTDDQTREESKKDIRQIQVVAYYKDQNKQEIGVTLFRRKMPKLPFKFLARDKIVGRALGRGGIEELFDPIIWTNWTEVKITEMLESASKMIGVTNDPTLKAKHPTGMKGMDNMEFLEVGEGKEARILDTYPRNLAVFNDALNRWESHAQLIGAASEGLLGEAPSSGTPFKLYEAQNIEAKSMHRYRQGQIAVFMDEIYRDWVLPHLAREITKDHAFLSELSADEMQSVSEAVMTNETNKVIKEEILSGRIVRREDVEMLKQTIKDGFIKHGNKKFIKILKDEMKDITLSVMTNIAGKQKNLALLTDKLVNVLRQFIATPQIRQDPEMVKLLNVILESSGMSPIMFPSSSMMQQPQQGGTEPLKQLGQANQQTAMV